ncbi:MAG: hypothetical protein JWM04_187, partial [Verrucomicrobiales bacterium]|nr:hypothetical protein [Verrucomicrobiales bacterium]
MLPIASFFYMKPSLQLSNGFLWEMGLETQPMKLRRFLTCALFASMAVVSNLQAAPEMDAKDGWVTLFDGK